jgi:hypothetical protein
VSGQVSLSKANYGYKATNYDFLIKMAAFSVRYQAKGAVLFEASKIEATKGWK